MKKSERNKIAASGALHMANDEGKKVAIAVDDDARARDMLKLVVRLAKQHQFDLGDTVHGNGVITVPVGSGEVRIVSADRLVSAPSATTDTILN
jgi:hypothetical protein